MAWIQAAVDTLISELPVRWCRQRKKAVRQNWDVKLRNPKQWFGNSGTNFYKNPIVFSTYNLKYLHLRAAPPAAGFLTSTRFLKAHTEILHPIQLVPFNTRKEQAVCREGIGLFLLMQEKEQAGLTEGEIKVIEGRKHNKKNDRPL